jgi:hypothetical protein
MAYLEGYNYDVFVSYAHGKLLTPYTRCLSDDLADEVNTRLGLKSPENQVKFWVDYGLERHRPLTGTLREAVQGSAILLLVMTDEWLDSPWCADEMGWFHEMVHSEISVGASRHVFEVRVKPLLREDRRPEFLRDERGEPLPGYEFYEAGKETTFNTFGWPEPTKKDREYWQRISFLADQIAKHLKARKAGGSMPPKPKPSPERSTRKPIVNFEPTTGSVYLAIGPIFDIGAERDELRALLEARNLTVIAPDMPESADQIPELAASAMLPCDAFVQIFGTLQGRDKPNQEDYVIAQFRKAQELGKPTIFCGSPSFDLSHVKDSSYKSFLENLNEVCPTEISDFVNLVQDRSREIISAPSKKRPIYILADLEDEDLEREVRHVIRSKGFLTMPVSRSDPKMKALGDSKLEPYFSVLNKCQGMLILSGRVKTSRPSWLDERVVDIEVEWLPNLERQPFPYAVVDRPPDPRADPSLLHVVRYDDGNWQRSLSDWLLHQGYRNGEQPIT